MDESFAPIVLCGGKGSRLEELTSKTNKPLIRIGGAPVLLHVCYRYWLAGARLIHLAAGWRYSKFFDEFNLALRELSDDPIFGQMIKDTEFEIHDTGDESDTFTRLKNLLEHIENNYFLVTYGDTITDVNCKALIKNFFSRCRGVDDCIVSVVQPKKRFSTISFDPGSNRVLLFEEKLGREKDWVGCGFMVLKRQAIQSVVAFESLEKEFLPHLVDQNKLYSNAHRGVWIPIDYLHDVRIAEEAMRDAGNGRPPWLISPEDD